ncbi:FxsA family protein [Desulfoluna sp.]|uniref:FxsA family protein n=1 Tax=Desulfoluna sp. TaxID=2045199 RepID=UPI002617C4AA|nr:FxsA family protein [Desulfoluna sp.]
MVLRLFLLFTLIPVIELWLLIKIGSIMGPFAAIALVIGTGIAGASLAKIQGLQTIMKIRACMDQGITPTEELIDGFMILIAGIVLITPGLLTDCTGILLLIPTSRNRIKAWAKEMFNRRIANSTIRIHRNF